MTNVDKRISVCISGWVYICACVYACRHTCTDGGRGYVFYNILGGGHQNNA